MWQRHLPFDYFGQTIETGSHLQSLRAVLTGEADAAALDSHLLDVLLQQEPGLSNKLRVVETLGPSPIPPLVIVKNLDRTLKLRIREMLLTMHRDPQAACELGKGRIKRFAPVSSEDYAVIGDMFDQVVQQINVAPGSVGLPESWRGNGLCEHTWT